MPANTFCKATKGKIYVKSLAFSDDSHLGYLPIACLFPRECRVLLRIQALGAQPTFVVSHFGPVTHLLRWDRFRIDSAT